MWLKRHHAPSWKQTWSGSQAIGQWMEQAISEAARCDTHQHADRCKAVGPMVAYYRDLHEAAAFCQAYKARQPCMRCMSSG